MKHAHTRTLLTTLLFAPLAALKTDICSFN